LDKAETALLKTLDLDATFSGAYYTLAMTYREARKLPQAAGQLETLISKKANDQRALMLLAMVYNEMKDYDKARKNYEKLLGINSSFLPALNNLAYLCAEQLGQLDKAYEFARKARDLRPDDPAIADTLGWILYKRGITSRPAAHSRKRREAARQPRDSNTTAE